MIKLLAIIFTSITLLGCATTQPSYTEKAMSLRMDMSKENVVSIMGSPKRISARKSPQGLAETYSWWNPKLIGVTFIDNEMLATDRLYVRFVDSKVTEWGDKYDHSDAMEKAMEKTNEMIKLYQPAPIAPK